MLFGKKAGKTMAALSACALAMTLLTLPSLDGMPKQTAVAYAEDVKVTYDFRDGSVIPTDTNGKSDVTKGALTVKVGKKNAYKYNGAQHGIEFKEGNSIEIAVDGPTKITVGDCAYSKDAELTLKSADGSYSETQSAKAGCFHNDGSAVVFKYKGSAATTLILEFTQKTYVPVITTEPLVPDTPDKNGTKKDTVHSYNFLNGSVVPAANDATNPVSGSVTSKDGFVTLTNKSGKLAYKDKKDGVIFNNSDTIEVKVAGDSIITFDLCGISTDSKGTISASSEKGEFVGEKTQLITDGRAEGLSTASFEYKGVAATLKFTVNASGDCYLHGINVSNLPEQAETPKAAGNGKIDVWDFGAEKLDESKYNNMLTADIINSWYSSDVKSGSTGATIGSFATDELVFSGGGNTNNRIRGGNEAITRYDNKTAREIEGVALNGYVYSNNASAVVYMGIKLYEGDILTLYTGSNGGASTIYCESPSGKIQVGESNGNGVKLTFNAPEYGMYKIYSVNEKLVVYRAMREHTAPTKVSGTVDTSAAAGIEKSGYNLRFTNKTTGAVTDVTPSDGKYSVYLNDSYKYDVSLVNANGFVIKSDSTIDVKSGAGTVTENIVISTVDLVTISGKITGLSEASLKNLKLSFVNKDAIYVPEFSVNGDKFTLLLEKGVKYDVVADGVNDYSLKNSTISKTASGADDIAFAAKTTYNVNLSYKGLPDSAAKTAAVTFTNLNEKGYSYTFKAGEKVQLRDGTYSVKVTGTGTEPYAQKVTSNLIVNGKAVDKEVAFEKVTVWDFSKYNSGNPGLEKIDGSSCYLGLSLNGSVAENKTYLLLNKDGEINVPVKKGQVVTLEYCYQAAFDANGEKVLSASGSTSKFETTEITATKDGTLTIKGIDGTADNGKTAKQTYFTKISVSAPSSYKSKITVGVNKDYKTINEALDAVRQMDRGSSNKRVTISIDPGNYEEMLVIDVPNVSLVNSAGKNSSLEITNKGVDIGKNVVRITSYYGHGYSYYSMGTDCKYDAELLAVNKANGSLSFANPGTGTTSGSYWNATVVVSGDGFEADGIVFENSFNQYISKKEAADTVVMWESGSKGQRPAKAGDTSVQNKSFVERAAAMAITGDKSVFNNCKFVGRQDTLYGGQDIKAVFQKCDVLGACDYIFGGMTAVFYQCNLVMNTDDASTSDVAYITAAQQKEGRGYLMYECNVTSTTPGVDTASTTRSKPGYFGRPWQPNTSEVVFYKTTVETTDYAANAGKSLIAAAGWNNGLGGTSNKMYEYGTVEKSGEDNSKGRADWSTVLDKPYIDNGVTAISVEAFLGDWTKELMSKGYVGGTADTTNPSTGAADAGTVFAGAAIAGAAIALSKKKRK